MRKRSMEREKFRLSLGPFSWVVVGLLLCACYLFQLSLTPGWMYTGDSATNVLAYYFQYSGLARGEYPLWNPLNRSGEPIYFFQALILANPLSNLTILISLLFGIKNIVFSYTIYIFLLISLYVSGVYLLVLALTQDRFAATFGALISLASSPVFYVTYSETLLKIIHAVPWILYSLIQYHKTIKFRYLAIFSLSFCSAIYSYQPTYAFSFLIFVFLSWLIFYWKEISTRNLKKIPPWHITLTAISLLLIILPIIQIALLMGAGDFLPPASRINLATITVTEDLNTKFDLFFNRLPEFFFARENLLTVIFTGAFWAKSADQLASAWTVLRHFLGPIAFPFLAVALFSRSRIVLCLGLSTLLIASQAGGYFPGNLLYKAPFFSYIKYASILNLFVIFSVIILASLGFNIFFKNKNSFFKRIVIGSTSLLIAGCISLAVVLPGRDYSNFALALTSITIVAATCLILSSQRISQKTLFNTLFAVMVVSSILFQSLVKSYHPKLNGQIDKTPNLLELRNKEDHSLHFLMERPASSGWVHELHGKDENKSINRNTTAGNDEYSSFTNLTDGSYKVLLTAHGLASYPITKDYFAFLSLPGHDELLEKKFHFFRHIAPISMPSYAKKLRHQPKLTSKLLENNIGIVTDPEYPQSPIYLKKDALDKLKNIEPHNSKNDFNVEVIEYKANSVRLQVTAEEAGLLAYTDTWDKGWHAKIDGEPVPVLKVFNILKGIELPPGTHQIEFYFMNGVLLSFIVMNVTFFIILFITASRLLLRPDFARKS